MKLMGAVLVVVLLGAGWLWLRDSSLFGVQQVTVRGVGGAESALISEALGNAARTMTTTDFDVARLESAVSRYPQVKSVSARTSFPHGVTIVVIERHPVAALLLAGRRVPVAGDGTMLPELFAPASLPSVAPPTMPAGQRVTGGLALQAVTVLAAAPGPLRARVTSVAIGQQGLTVYLRNGPPLYFGDATLPHAKWLAVAAVLADPSSQGAQYLDVRVPSRPVAQVGDGATSIQSAGTGATTTGTTVSPSATLAVTGQPSTGG